MTTIPCTMRRSDPPRLFRMLRESALVLGDAVGVREVAGIVLILAGVWLVGWQSARYKRTA